MKKTFALLLACLMLVAMLPGTALAYDKANFTGSVAHTLTLTESTLQTLPYDITYEFAYDGDGTVEVVSPTFKQEYINSIGSPVIESITYEAGVTPDSAKKYTKTLKIDWSNVTITEPGVYRWKFKQTADTQDPDKENNIKLNTNSFYLYAYVTANSDHSQLTAKVILYSGNENKMEGGIGEAYPAKSLSLTLSKNVTGNQASQNQYFKYSLSLKSPSGAAAMEYLIDYTNADESFEATPYNEAVSGQPGKISVPANGTGTAEIWLKHGQSITINGLLFDTEYTIVESENDGYEVYGTISENSGAQTTKFTDNTVSKSLTSTSVVAYTNRKDTVVPTGISLHTAAPVMGILLAMSLLAILFVGKRKEYVA